MASLNERFKHITKYGISRPNRFNVIIALPQAVQDIINNKKSEGDDNNFLEPLIGEDGVGLVKAYLGSGTEIVRGLDIMCESAELPGKSFSTSETKYNSDYLNLPFDITYAPITITFVVSRDLLEKNIIDEWMNFIINPSTHDIAYFEDFASPSIEIQQLNEQDQVTHKAILKDAYPSELTAMALNNETTDDYHRLSVTFLYRSWKTSDEPQPSGVTSLAQTPLGPLTTPILSNPAVQRATDYLKDQDIDLEGAAVDVYNQIDSIVQNTTGESVNQSASLLNGIKAQLDINNEISDIQKAELIDIIDGTINNLG